MSASRLVLGQDSVEVGGHFGGVPVLRADYFAEDFPLAVNDVGLRPHGSAIVGSDLFRRVAIRRKVDALFAKEPFVCPFILVDADAEHLTPAGSDALLESDEAGGFLNTRATPTGPEIQNDNLSVKVRKMGSPAVQIHGKVFRCLAGNGGFALAVVGESEKGKDRKSKAHAPPREESPEKSIHIKL